MVACCSFFKFLSISLPIMEHAMAGKSSISSALAQLDSVIKASASPISKTSNNGSKRVRREPAIISTPALMSLLPVSRKRQRISVSTSSTSLNQTNYNVVKMSAGYQPNSLDSLQNRLASFTLGLWTDTKPGGCEALDFARFGWICTGNRREEVRCVVCESVWTPQNSKDWKSELGKTAAIEIRNMIAEKHKKSCPWRTRPCTGKQSPDCMQAVLS